MFVLLRSFVFTHLDQRPNFIKKLSLYVLLCPVALCRRFLTPFLLCFCFAVDSLIVRPRIKGEEDYGAQLPLLVSPYRP